MKLRLRLAKRNIFLSHLEFIRAVTRGLRRTGMPVKYTEGYHPRVRLSSGPALALGIESNMEYIDIELTEQVELAGIKDTINKNLPEGIEVMDVKEISCGDFHIAGGRYLIGCRFSNLPQRVFDGFHKLKNGGDIYIKRNRKGIEKNIKVMDYIKEIRLFENDRKVEMCIEGGPQGSLNPIELLREIEGKEVLKEDYLVSAKSFCKVDRGRIKIEKIDFKEC